VIDLANANCDACARAAQQPDTPFQRAGCKGCAVRALAQGPMFHQSGLDGHLGSAYRKALAQIFEDDWRAGHEMVKAEHQRIREARALL
jgi:hypothetical protein